MPQPQRELGSANSCPREAPDRALPLAVSPAHEPPNGIPEHPWASLGIAGHPCLPPSARASRPRCQVPDARCHAVQRERASAMNAEWESYIRHRPLVTRRWAIGLQPFGRLELDPEQALTSPAPSPLSALSAKSANSANSAQSELSARSAPHTPYPSIRQSVSPSVPTIIPKSIWLPARRGTSLPVLRILELNCME
jgi:hypothetical protein